MLLVLLSPPGDRCRLEVRLRPEDQEQSSRHPADPGHPEVPSHPEVLSDPCRLAVLEDRLTLSHPEHLEDRLILSHPADLGNLLRPEVQPSLADLEDRRHPGDRCRPEDPATLEDLANLVDLADLGIPVGLGNQSDPCHPEDLAVR